MAVITFGMAEFTIYSAPAASCRIPRALKMKGQRQNCQNCSEYSPKRLSLKYWDNISSQANNVCVCVYAHAYIWTPARLPCDPADLSLAHETTDPVTAILLLHDHFAFGTIHGLSIL